MHTRARGIYQNLIQPNNPNLTWIGMGKRPGPVWPPLGRSADPHSRMASHVEFDRAPGAYPANSSSSSNVHRRRLQHWTPIPECRLIPRGGTHLRPPRCRQSGVASPPSLPRGGKTTAPLDRTSLATTRLFLIFDNPAPLIPGRIPRPRTRPLISGGGVLVAGGALTPIPFSIQGPLFTPHFRMLSCTCALALKLP